MYTFHLVDCARCKLTAARRDESAELLRVEVLYLCPLPFGVARLYWGVPSSCFLCGQPEQQQLSAALSYTERHSKL